MPPLVVTGSTPREKARSVLQLVFTAWYRGRNGKPRKRLNGQTPAEAYANAHPTPKQVDEAYKWFQELQRREERARSTREARRDPVRLELLVRGLAELGIEDPEQRLAVSLAYYCRDAIVRGLATFAAKQHLGKIPTDADHGRYLGGIIRKLDERLELEETSRRLLEQRIRLGDITLRFLENAAAQLRTVTPPSEIPKAIVDRALGATYTVDFHFWASYASEVLAGRPHPQRAILYQSLTRRIAASFKTDRDRRDALIDRLAEATARAA
jgi:hypothetical protein